MAGTALTSGLGFVAWTPEASFGETGDDSYSFRMLVRDAMIDVSGLVRPMQERGGTFQRIGETDKRILGPFSVGTFTTTLDLGGHGDTTAGALTQTDLAALLAHAIGNYDGSTVGGNITTNSSNATDLTSTEASIVLGKVFRVGALGDGRAEGQATVATTSTSSWILKVAMAGNATTADNIYAMMNIYPFTRADSSLRLESDGGTSNNTLRFVLATANYQYVCRGCACTGISITGLSPGETPRITLTWATVAWNPVAQTFPSVTDTVDTLAAPCSGGSLFYNAVGTATRNTDVVRRFEINIGHSMIPVVGQGGATAGQTVVGWCRGNAQTTVRFAVEAESATTTPEWFDWFGTNPYDLVAKHVLYTWNPTDGDAGALYLPYCLPSDRQPTQVEIDGLNYVDVELVCSSTRQNTEILEAPYILALG